MNEQEAKIVLVNIDMTSNSVHQSADKEVKDPKDFVNDLKDSHKDFSKELSKETNKESKEICMNPLVGVADISPNKRYIRWNDLISKSSGERSSYKAFDTRNGIEVVWHTIDLNSLEESDQNRVTKCVKMIQKIQHKYIMEYQGSWFNAETRSLNIITTHLEPLDEFIGKVMTLRWRIVKKWSKQILRGLDFLHTSKPEIVHRNLSCSHIYINGGTSHTNIGDLWTAAILAENEDAPIGLTTTASSAYTAPEEQLSTKLDVYSFGMCLLEMITREKPYVEFKGSYDLIREHAIHGKLPKALDRVTHPLARQCIEACLQPVDRRPDAAELLQHAFLQPGPEDDEELKLGNLELTLQAPRTAPSSAAGTPRERTASLDAMPSAAATPNINSNLTPSPAPITSIYPTIAAPTAAPEAGNLTTLTETNANDKQATKLTSTEIPQPPPMMVGRSSNSTPETRSIKLLSTKEINSPSSLKQSRHNQHSMQSTVSSPTNSVPVIPVLSFHTPNQTERKKQTLSQELADFDQSENVQEDKGIHDGRSSVVDDELTPHQSGKVSQLGLTRIDSAKVIKASLQDQMANAQDPPIPINNVLKDEGEYPVTPKQVLIQGKSSSLEVSSEDSKLQLIIFIPAEKTKTKTTDQEIEFDYDVLNENFEGVAKEMIEELGILVPVKELAGQIESLVRQAIRSKKESKRINPSDVASAFNSPQNQNKPAKTVESALQLSIEKKVSVVDPISPAAAVPPDSFLAPTAYEFTDGRISQLTLVESVSPLSLSESVERKTVPISISELTERLIEPAIIEFTAKEADTPLINLLKPVESVILLTSTEATVTAQSIEVDNASHPISIPKNGATSLISPPIMTAYECNSHGVQPESEGTRGSHTDIQHTLRDVDPVFDPPLSNLTCSGHNDTIIVSLQATPPLPLNLDSSYFSNDFDSFKHSNINADDCSTTSSMIASPQNQQQFFSSDSSKFFNYNLARPNYDIPSALTISIDPSQVPNRSLISSIHAASSLPTSADLDQFILISADQVRLIPRPSSPHQDSIQVVIDETLPSKQLVLSGTSAVTTSVQLDNNLNTLLLSSSSLANQAKGRSRSNTQTIEMSDAEVGEIQKELEKIEKEARAARRAFEQRIQKHKIIQEKCQEDMQRLEEEFSAKMAELDTKVENCLRKKEEEIQKVYTDLELKQRAYKEMKRAARAQARLASRKSYRSAQQQNSLQLQEQQLSNTTSQAQLT